MREDGDIRTAGCSCMAGQGRGCSHVAALLYKMHIANIKGYIGIACTDRTNQWNRETKRNVEPGPLRTIDFKSNQLDSPADVVAAPLMEKFHQSYDHAELQAHVAQEPICSGLLIPGSIFSRTVSYQITHDVRQQPTSHTPLQHGNHDLDYTMVGCIPECEPCRLFYNRFVGLSEGKCDELSEMTLEQSVGQSKRLCSDSRKVRITASTAKSVPKRAKTDPSTWISGHLYNSFKGTAATRHGNRKEATARAAYEQATSSCVRMSGLVVHKSDSWLAASPDGLVGTDQVLEIKCPYQRTIDQLSDDPRYDLGFDENKHPFLRLNGKNGYYTQVQLTMHCAAKRSCDFFVWTEEQQVSVSVPYVEAFAIPLVTRLRAFYFKSLLPTIVDDHDKQVLGLSKAFTNFCS